MCGRRLKTEQRVAILGDLPGPKMRIGRLAEEPIELERMRPFVLQTEEIVGNQRAGIAGFPQAARSGKTG